MKTKEEIEQLAKQLCNIPIDLVIDEEERYYKNLEKYDGIIQGYTQCQEDMADKKYTEEDIKKAIELARETESVRRGALSEDWDDIEKYDEMDIIYLLNNQNK